MTIFQDSIVVVIFILLFVVFLAVCALIDCVYRMCQAKKHRRQHNIFEAGDLVVSKNGCELVSEITYLQGGLAKIKNEKFDHVYSLQDFRHAEPEEIKAGRRL